MALDFAHASTRCSRTSLLAVLGLLFAAVPAHAGGLAPSITSLRASPTSMAFTAGTVEISGSAANAESCSLSVKPSVASLIPTASCASFTTQAQLPARTKASPLSYIFTFTAKSKFGTATATTVVTVAAYPAPVISDPSVSPVVPLSGGTLQLGIDTSFATKCAVSVTPKFKGSSVSSNCVGGTVSMSLPPNATGATTYTATLSASGPGGKTMKTFTFTAAAALGKATAVASGSTFNCAVVRAGRVACWGMNDHGQMGDGTITPSNASHSQTWAPRLVPGIAGATSVVAGASGACTLTAKRQVYCWGNCFGNGAVQCWGNGGLPNAKPRQVPFASDDPITAISMGGESTCGLLSSGRVKCWGWGPSLGAGADVTGDVAEPKFVKGIDHAVAISVGSSHTCAVLVDGHLRCWGSNAYGMLGNPDCSAATPVVPTGCTYENQVRETEPIEVVGIADAVSVAAGRDHTCASLQTGLVKCWGYGLRLGSQSGSNILGPTETHIADVKYVAAASTGTFAVLNNGDVVAWGQNLNGTLGVNNGADQPVPARVLGVVNPVAIAIATNACIVVSDGRIACTGDNLHGERGVPWGGYWGIFNDYIPGIG